MPPRRNGPADASEAPGRPGLRAQIRLASFQEMRPEAEGQHVSFHGFQSMRRHTKERVSILSLLEMKATMKTIMMCLHFESDLKRPSGNAEGNASPKERAQDMRAAAIRSSLSVSTSHDLHHPPSTSVRSELVASSVRYHPFQTSSVRYHPTLFQT